MKKIRVAALVLAMIMLTFSIAACSKTEKVKVNCTVSVIIDGEVMLDNYAYQVEGPVDNPPTILQAVQEACMTLDIPCEADDAGLSVQSFTFDGVTYSSGSDGENIYSWYYTINGAEPEANSGRAGNRAVEEGQAICYIYTATPINPQEFSSGEE